MATGKRPPSGSSGDRRRRPVPTIDLKATEVSSKPIVTPPPPLDPEPVQTAAAASAPPEPPHVPPEQAPPFEPPPPPPPGISWLPPDVPWPLVAAGAAGAAAVMLFVMLIWLISPRTGDAVATLTPRLTAIETQLRDLAARPAPQGIDPQAIDALSARLARLETAVAAPRPPATDAALTGRVGTLEGAVKPLNDSIAALTRRADETDAAFRNVRGRADTADAALTELRGSARTATADHGEIAKLVERIAALEKSGRSVTDELAKRAASGSDRAVRLAVATAALRAALERGDPYAAELAGVRPLGGNGGVIAAVEPFAATGVPAAAVLGRELLVLLPVLQRAAGTATRDSGFLDRLQANAERLVRVRPIEEVPGEDTAAILSRIELRAAQSDIAGALTELNKLPAAMRAPASDWIAKAQTRGKAIDAGRRLATDAVSALQTTQ